MPEIIPQPNLIEVHEPLHKGDEGGAFVGVVAIVGISAVAAGLLVYGGNHPELGQKIKETVGMADKTASAPATHEPKIEKDSPSSAECMGDLSNAAKVGQLLMPGFTSDQIPRATTAFERYHVGSAIIMGKVPESAAPNLKRLTEENPAGLNLAVDDEGGLVQRTGSKMPSQLWVAQHRNPKQAEQIAFNHAAGTDSHPGLADYGINFNASPVVDVDPDTGPSGTPGAGRTFGNKPQDVITYGQAYVNGIERADVHPIIKHWPGHGSASGDTHKGPATTPNWSSLQGRDVAPFKDIIEHDQEKGHKGPDLAVMVGHLTVPGLTEKDTPASMSPKAISYLRGKLDFNGIIMTDDLKMGGSLVEKTLPEAAVAAIDAGADVALYVSTGSGLDSDTKKVSSALLAAVKDGDISQKQLDTSVARILDAKGVTACEALKELK